VRPPLTSTLTFSACLPIPLALRTRLWISQSPHRIAAGWTSLQSQPIFCSVCLFRCVSSPPDISAQVRPPVPPPLLRTPLLPWTVWIALLPLSPLPIWLLPLKPQGRCLNPSLRVSLACLVLRILSVTKRSLVYMSCPLGNLLLVLPPPHLHTVMMKFLFLPVLLWFGVIVMMRFLFHVLCFLVPPPLPVPLFVLPLGLVADALLGMGNIDCFFFLSHKTRAERDVNHGMGNLSCASEVTTD
jgi:hypothetical protein